MTVEHKTSDQRMNLLCRLFGHKWTPAHVVGRTLGGTPAWIYTDHVCLRCYRTEYRLQNPREIGNV